MFSSLVGASRLYLPNGEIRMTSLMGNVPTTSFFFSSSFWCYPGSTRMASTVKTAQSLCCTPCLEFGDNDELVVGNAYDVIVVRSNDGFFSNESFVAIFPKRIEERHRLFLELGMESMDNVTYETGARAWFEVDFDGTFLEKSTFLQLAHMLRPGRNPARYLLVDEENVVGVADTNVFLWSGEDRVIISDIDGTITKSNAGGIFDTILTESYQHCHEAVCQFFSTMASKERTRVLYVTSRPVSLAVRTRKFIDNLRQQHHSLPEGPVLGFLGSIPQLLIMELVAYRTHHFKAEILWKNVVEPFRRAGLTHPFQAAFGNTFLDVQAYGMVAVPLTRTYLIKKSKIHSFDGDRGEEELLKLNLDDQRTTKSWGNEMPTEWYKRKMGSVFEGYGDPRLQEHVLVS